jgi:hypothetical protein
MKIARLALDTLPEYLTQFFHESGITEFKFAIEMNNLLTFILPEDDIQFKIVDMSYNFKIATGFYYPGALPISSHLNERTGFHEITARAVAFTASTPVLFLLSNTGGRCFHMSVDDHNVQNGVIGMVINNNFITGLPAIFQQGDIVSQCLSSDLTYIRLSLVDSNFHTVKLLNPLYCTLQVQEIGDSSY